MRYAKLGQTDMTTSVYGLGGGAFARFYGSIGEDEARDILVAGLKSGVNYIDTAPWYGQGRSEQFIGNALKAVPRGAYYLATKVMMAKRVLTILSIPLPREDKSFAPDRSAAMRPTPKTCSTFRWLR